MISAGDGADCSTAQALSSCINLLNTFLICSSVIAFISASASLTKLSRSTRVIIMYSLIIQPLERNILKRVMLNERNQHIQQRSSLIYGSRPQKYCKHCGERIDVECVVCPKCGKQVEELRSPTPQVVVTNTNVNTNINSGGRSNYPYKKKSIALLLAIFLGGFGAHRFYVGKTGTGIIWLCTGGLCGIGWLVDIIMIAFGGFRDKARRSLT